MQQAQEGDSLGPGPVYTIPPGLGLLIEGGRLLLTDVDQPRLEGAAAQPGADLHVVERPDQRLTRFTF